MMTVLLRREERVGKYVRRTGIEIGLTKLEKYENEEKKNQLSKRIRKRIGS
jgi:hypothetical protein